MTGKVNKYKKPEAAFNSDIDNFKGVKAVKNYVILSINDQDV